MAAELDIAKEIWPSGRGVPDRTLRCRHCSKRNRVAVASAALRPDRYHCGACKKALFVGADEPLRGLASEAYQHSLDRRWLGILRSVPGLPEFVRWAFEQVGDRSAQQLFMSDAIHCDENQFPELVALVDLARTRLDLPVCPTVYLGESPHMNAATTGVRAPMIVVRSALLDQMDDAQLLGILGHELGHLHAGHPLYQTVARLALFAGSTFSPLVRAAGFPLGHALLEWSRCAELTADRAALLASRDVPACIGMLLTLAGGNRPGTASRTEIRLGPFIEQCRTLEATKGKHTIEGVLEGYFTMDRTHPHVAARVVRLLEWVEHGSFLPIMAGQYVRRRRRRRRSKSEAQQLAPATLGAEAGAHEGEGP